MSRNKQPIGTKGKTTPLTNEAMERCGELPTVEHMYGYMVAHAMDLEQKLAESRLAGPARLELPSQLWLAQWFHDTYERLAPEYGYVTRNETRVFDPFSPNGKLMIAVCKQLREALDVSHATTREPSQ